MVSLSKDKNGQEIGIEKLYSFVLLIVLVGMIIGVGILTLDKLSSATFYKGESYNDTVAITINTTVNLDFGNITNVRAVWNGSSIFPSNCYTINTTDGHFIWYNQTTNLDGGIEGCDPDVSTNFYAIYDYRNYHTATRDATASVSKEVANIATDWLGLIVTVFILSIILFFVVRSFGPNMGSGR